MYYNNILNTIQYSDVARQHYTYNIKRFRSDLLPLSVNASECMQCCRNPLNDCVILRTKTTTQICV
jgi:hypothetical protein